jgi:hypothetical protein
MNYQKKYIKINNFNKYYNNTSIKDHYINYHIHKQLI